MTGRGILLGSMAFGVVFLLEGELGTVFNDMRRYDKLRAMSGDPPLYMEGLTTLARYVFRNEPNPGDEHSDVVPAKVDAMRDVPSAPSGGRSLFDTLLSDALRYVTMRSM